MLAIYRDLTLRVKVNGNVGASVRVTNGVRQGCGASPLVFLLVQEALLISIRRDRHLEGIRIPGADWEARERCAADDTVVYLRGARQLPRLARLIHRFECASGQVLNLRDDKTSALLFGPMKNADIAQQISDAHGCTELNRIDCTARLR
eukprot:3684436-Prymnesium_polylepis.1